MKKKNPILNKTGINLAMHEDHSASIRLLLIGCLLIFLLAGAVAKVGVIDQYARLNAAEDDYLKVHNQHLSMSEALKDYKKVEQEYRTHSMDWLKSDPDGAYVTVDRQKVLDLVEAELMSRGQVTSVAIFNNQMNVAMSGMNLTQVTQMMQALNGSPIVAEAQLNDAEKEEDESDLLVFTLTIFLQEEEVAQ